MLEEIVTFMQNPYPDKIEDFSTFIDQPGKFNTAATDEYYLEMKSTLTEPERMKIMAKYQLPPYRLLLLPNGVCIGFYRNDSANLSVFNYDRSLAFYIECPSEHYYVGSSLELCSYENDNSNAIESILHEQQPLEIFCDSIRYGHLPRSELEIIGGKSTTFKLFCWL